MKRAFIKDLHKNLSSDVMLQQFFNHACFALTVQISRETRRATMAPRGKDADLQTQEVLQAVVLADSFAHHFRPISIHMPKVLIPLAATPMLEYTLEFLAAGGVQEIFVFCCAHAEIIERYVEETELRRRLGTVTLHILVARAPCFSAGDALREVEAAGVIKSDFVLVPGDVVANLQLAPLLAAHKARREADREAVLTTVMKRIPPGHRSRRAGACTDRAFLMRPTQLFAVHRPLACSHARTCAWTRKHARAHINICVLT
eukprot:6200761-Pleurochrysis_carterae.AAC.2